MKQYYVPFLAICCLISSCVATVPSMPTSHIPEKAHEINVSGAIGIPRFSGNVSYNPHKNFGFVLSGNAGKESLADFFIVGLVAPNKSKWRTYAEAGVAGYYPVNDWFAISLTPTIGRGKFFVVDGTNYSSYLDTVGGYEIRQALFLNTRFKLTITEEFNAQFRVGLKVANNRMTVETTGFRDKILAGQTFNLTTVEPMFYSDFQFRNFALFSILGLDISKNTYKNTVIESTRSPFYLGVGLGYTFNGLKPWEGKPEKKKHQ
jgi:hypothetical protein